MDYDYGKMLLAIPKEFMIKRPAMPTSYMEAIDEKRTFVTLAILLWEECAEYDAFEYGEHFYDCWRMGCKVHRIMDLSDIEVVLGAL